MTGAGVRAVVFDIGNVLIEWDPRHLYREIFDGDEALMEAFLAEVCTPAWNLEQDRGRPWAEGLAALIAEFPDCRELIRAFYERWDEMVPGEVPGGAEIVADLQARGVPLYAITNFSDEKFAESSRRFPVFAAFEEILVSGALGLVKPDPAIYRLLLERRGLAAGETLFIDDSPANVEAAEALGMIPHHFTSAAKLRVDLERLGLL